MRKILYLLTIIIAIVGGMLLKISIPIMFQPKGDSFTFFNPMPAFTERQQTIFDLVSCQIYNNLSNSTKYYPSTITINNSDTVFVHMSDLSALREGGNKSGKFIVLSHGGNYTFKFDKDLRLIGIVNHKGEIVLPKDNMLELPQTVK